MAYMRWIARPELDSAVALHCTSQPEAEDLRRLGLRPPKVVIPHGLRTDEFAELPPRGKFRHGDTPVLLFFGRIHPKKGFDLLFPAMEMLAPRYDFHLLIAGTGDDAYIATLRDLGGRTGALIAERMR